ncbi:pyridoxamine 5'-phosphate oxidase family protein [Geomonas sp. RF6]|uniref:pyridoxamine 5'-phosphate oxidase family protein n=1 Tax=Geomonas sp. RF6 TaxID=2897342 RepID=UPI001E2AAD12|nr:pyridoxamine 5'-phosphate oxidase family protein [Geomonas sp. RF6]UFS72619.1 pyridoxamine 5'-phosphate oxidase family protein [Geomonas sp. RF6]
MNLAELFPEGGRGVIGTADAQGQVDLAVFAIPHIVDEETLAWGVGEGRTYHNLKENAKASYLYIAPTRGYNGWRLTLSLKEMGEGALLEEIRARAAKNSWVQDVSEIKHVLYFKVDEVRPLV